MFGPPREPPLVVGRYALFDVIGGGGMARVHLGRILGAAGFSRVVAIKRLHPGSSIDPELTTMLTDEARLASRIRHANVVPVVDVVAHAGELLLVMEYAPGVALGHLQQLAHAQHVPVPQPIALRIALDVLAGLEAAHEATSERGEPLGLVHRDISPQNVIVGADGHARIVDFGIAKANTRLGGTDAGLVKGKLGYMPPEQLCGEPVDRRTDVYACGVVLWQLLTGRRLYDARHEEAPAIIRRTLERDADPPGRHAPVPPALDALVVRALARDRNRRFPTAAAMAAAIEALGGAATWRDVAAFVRALAGGEIEQRAELVARIEQTPVEAPDPHTGPPHTVPTPRTSAPGFAPTPYPSAPAFAPARPPSSPGLVAPGFPGHGGTSTGVVALRPPGAPGAAPAPLPRRRGPLLRWVALGALAVLLVVFVGGAAWLAAPAKPTARATTTTSGAPAAPLAAAPASAAEPAPEATAPPAAIAPPTTTAPSAATAQRGSPGRPRRTAAPAASASGKPSCDPPYVIDARGIRVPRRECLEN